MKTKIYYDSYEYSRGLIPTKLEVIICSWRVIYNQQYATDVRNVVSTHGKECWNCNGKDRECDDYMENKE